MRKRRTKKQKVKSKKRRLKEVKKNRIVLTQPNEFKNKDLIIKDLIKSIIISIIILGLLIIIYFNLNT